MIRALIVCASLSGILSGCSDSLADASGNEAISEHAKCEAIVAQESQVRGREVGSGDFVASPLSNDLLMACRQLSKPSVVYLHLRYGIDVSQTGLAKQGQ